MFSRLLTRRSTADCSDQTGRLRRALDEADAVDSPIGYLPKAEDIDLEDAGVDLNTLKGLLEVDPALWQEEAAGIHTFYQKFGNKLPQELSDSLEELEARLAE